MFILVLVSLWHLKCKPLGCSQGERGLSGLKEKKAVTTLFGSIKILHDTLLKT